MNLMWSRTTQRNVIGLCELVHATTDGTTGIGDYDEVVLTIDEIQGFLKVSRREAYAARSAAVDLTWLEHRHEPGVGEVYKFFAQRIEDTPELTDRRTRRKRSQTACVPVDARVAALLGNEVAHPDAQTRNGAGRAFVHLDAQTNQNTLSPDGPESAPRCTGNQSCPYINESDGGPEKMKLPSLPVSAEAKKSHMSQQNQTTQSPMYSMLYDYLSDKFAARGSIRKKPDRALLVALIEIIEKRGATLKDFKLHVDARDKRDPVRSYGLLFECANECLIGEESSLVEEGDNLTPDERRYLKKRAAHDAEAGGDTGDTSGDE